MQRDLDAARQEGRWREAAAGLILAALCLSVLLLIPRLPKGTLVVDGEAILPGRTDTAALVLAYFGFPGCTDTCPVALAELAALQRLARSQGIDGRLEFAFVNLDPWADADALAAWLAGFDPGITGFLPGPEGLAELERRLGLVLRTVPGRRASHADYFVLLSREPAGGWRVLDRSRRPDARRLLQLARDLAVDEVPALAWSTP